MMCINYFYLQVRHSIVHITNTKCLTTWWQIPGHNLQSPYQNLKSDYSQVTSMHKINTSGSNVRKALGILNLGHVLVSFSSWVMSHQYPLGGWVDPHVSLDVTANPHPCQEVNLSLQPFYRLNCPTS